MAKRLLSVQKIVNLSSDPATGSAGELYYNTVTNNFKYFNGTAWTEITGGGGGAAITVSETPPSSPVEGNLWYNSAEAKLLIYYDNTWVEAGGPGAFNGLENVNEDATPELGGNLDASSFNITNVDNLSFDTTPDNPGGIATLVWDDGDGTLSLGLKGGNVNLQIGQEEVALCYNGTGSTLTEGTVVYVVGAQGQRPRVAKANATSESTSSKTFGIVTENIANGAEGFVTTFGLVRGLNTISFAEGSALWLSTTDGLITTTQPTPPNHSVFLGYCIRSHASSGEIFVKIQNGYELEELHNVLISSPQNGQGLVYESSTGLWKNQNVDALPSQTGNSGKYLTTNGTVASWGTIDLSGYAPLNSPSFTGTPTAPTAAAATNTTQIATTAFVRTEVANLIDSAPSTLDTLNELAAALGDDPNFATTMTNALAAKAPLSSPTFTGVPLAPTAAVDTNTTQIATTAFVIGQGYLKSSVASTTYAPINSPSFTGTPTAPTPPTTADDNRIATTAWVNSAVGTREVIPLDDISSEFDGRKLRFIPKYDNEVVVFTNPYELILMINGIIQKVGHPDVVWQSGIPREGFFLDWQGFIQFSEAPPAGSSFDARLFPVSSKDNSLYYPFSAVDIYLGA